MALIIHETNSKTEIDYDSGISINEQDDLDEYEHLLKEIPETCGENWKLGWSSLGGRGIIADKAIEPGQLIFTNFPVVLGPRGGMEGEAMCVSCFRSGVQLKSCSKGCRLPLCSVECQETHSKSPECEALIKLGVKDGDSWSPELYRALAPFRCLHLRKKEKKLIKILQAHPPNGVAPEVKLLQRSVTNDLSAEDQSWMDHCCRVMDASAFQSFSDNFDSKQTQIRGVYPLAGLLNHSCTPNARQVFEMNHRMKLVAVKPIPKDEEITISYCPLLWATPIRISFLLKTKHFICNCQRCLDPTEMGTYLSGLICGCGGIILPVAPQDTQTEWKCNKCVRTLSNRQALIASSILSTNNRNSKNNLSLAENNHILLDSTLKNLLSQKNNLKDTTEEGLIERETEISRVLKLLEKLDLGECRTKGLLLYELYKTLTEKSSRCTNYNKEILENLLEQSRNILEGDISVPHVVSKFLSKS